MALKTKEDKSKEDKSKEDKSKEDFRWSNEKRYIRFFVGTPLSEEDVIETGIRKMLNQVSLGENKKIEWHKKELIKAGKGTFMLEGFDGSMGAALEKQLVSDILKQISDLNQEYDENEQSKQSKQCQEKVGKGENGENGENEENEEKEKEKILKEDLMLMKVAVKDGEMLNKGIEEMKKELKKYENVPKSKGFGLVGKKDSKFANENEYMKFIDAKLEEVRKAYSIFERLLLSKHFETAEELDEFIERMNEAALAKEREKRGVQTGAQTINSGNSHLWQHNNSYNYYNNNENNNQNNNENNNQNNVQYNHQNNVQYSSQNNVQYSSQNNHQPNQFNNSNCGNNNNNYSNGLMQSMQQKEQESQLMFEQYQCQLLSQQNASMEQQVKDMQLQLQQAAQEQAAQEQAAQEQAAQEQAAQAPDQAPDQASAQHAPASQDNDDDLPPP